MADETPPVDLMGYDEMVQEAQRGVVRAALERAALPEGVPGEHQLYITFLTRAVGVSVPPDILAKYPEEMTVVLQHQFWDLKVEARRFSVMLKFGGVPRVLNVPYTAITRFYDPSVNFLMPFDPASQASVAPPEAPPPEEPTPPSTDDGPKVVSLDQFRKK